MSDSKLNFKEGDHVTAKAGSDYKITNESTKCVVVETHSFVECMDIVVLEGKHKDYRATVPMCDFKRSVSEDDYKLFVLYAQKEQDEPEPSESFIHESIDQAVDQFGSYDKAVKTIKSFFNK